MGWPDLAVVGGGLLGRLLAWRAARAGMSVSLYEAGGRLGEESAAWAAAGMIAPDSEALDASPQIVAMGRRSLELWPVWLTDLPKPVSFRDSGTVSTWVGDARGEAERLEVAVQALGGKLERVGQERLMELEPLVAAEFPEAIYLPDEGQVDNREVLAALALALEDAGVVCHWYTKVADDAMPEAGVVADCRGMGGREALTGLQGVRGEILRLHAPGVELRHMVRLIGGQQPIYLVPRAEGRLVVGATAYQSDDRSPASVGGVMRLLAAAVSVLPGLTEARILEFATQVRPALGDRQPVMQWNSDGELTPSRILRDRTLTSRVLTSRILTINGLYRHGFLLSPAIVEKALARIANYDGAEQP